MSADNRFMLADIAAALECSVSDLADETHASGGQDTAAALATMPAICRALVETDLDERPLCEPRPIDALRREADLVADLRARCDFAGAGNRIPPLPRELHATAAAGKDTATALRLLIGVVQPAAGTVRYPCKWREADQCTARHGVQWLTGCPARRPDAAARPSKTQT